MTDKRLSRIFSGQEALLHLPLHSDSKYVLFSDCHRGVGNANDNFLKNESLYLAALDYYYRNGFSYIELGDGDELWENRSIHRIKEVHGDSFRMLARFYAASRLYLVYGNHDIVKKNLTFSRSCFDSFYCDRSFCCRPLFPDVRFYEGIILHDSLGQRDLYLIHGHQAEALNSTFWRLSRFLVRYAWKPLESLGVPDPTSAAKNNTRKQRTEKTLITWAKKHQHFLITGHTHRPMAASSDTPYMNTGSCIHPSGITCIEIEGEKLSLIKWHIAAGQDMVLRVTRSVLEPAPENL